MGMAADMRHNIDGARVTEEGRKAASHYKSMLGEQLRRILGAQNAFRDHEIDAIVDSFVCVLQRDGQLTESALADELHSRAIPKDLAKALAHALSYKR